MLNISNSTIDRIAALAVQEHRTLEGQLLAMADLYERTYKIKSMQMKRPRGRPPKAKVVQMQPILQEKPAKKKRTRKGHAITQETREKISRANKGKVKSEVTRQKLSYAMKLSHAKRRLAKMKDAQKNPELFSLGASPSE